MIFSVGQPCWPTFLRDFSQHQTSKLSLSNLVKSQGNMVGRRRKLYVLNSLKRLKWLWNFYFFSGQFLNMFRVCLVCQNNFDGPFPFPKGFFQNWKNYSRIFLRKCISTSLCSRLFPIIELRYVFIRFKAGKMSTLSTFVACESKSNLTIFSASLTKKCLFYDISCSFLIMVLISIVPLSFSSNKLGNNFNCDSNLLIPMSLLLISSKKVLSCNWSSTATSGALFD